MLLQYSKARIPTKERMQVLVHFWKNSNLFIKIDTRVSEHYRRRLKNDGFTILSSNCVAGIIYHRLGKQFLSPTINMWFPQPDFIDFCLHLDYYLGQDLNFIETDKDYPVAKIAGNGEDLPTITLNFNHCKEPETAKNTWEKRKTRINRNNLYVMLYNLDGMTVEKLKSLEQFQCKGKVVFSAKPLPEIPWSFYIKPIQSHRYPMNYLEKDICGVRYFEKKFDFVSFLNDELPRYR